MGSNKNFDEYIANTERLHNLVSEQFADVDLPEDYSTDYTTAEWQYKCIREEVKEFENNLDNDHEVALQLTNFGKSILLNVTNIGYQNPCLIYYYGTVNGKYCQLIQHVSQINFLLMSVEKEHPQKPPRRIGF